MSCSQPSNIVIVGSYSDSEILMRGVAFSALDCGSSTVKHEGITIAELI